MSNLVQTLQEKTQSFKITFLDETEKWSLAQFDVMSERKKWDDEKWCKFLGLEPRFEKGRFGDKDRISFPANFFNTAKSRDYYREVNKARTAVQIGIEKFVAKELDNAEKHFENSLLKLADRISKKGLNESAIKIESVHIGVNLEITITDGSKTVRAFTIIASGAVQRPHYRYLIK